MKTYSRVEPLLGCGIGGVLKAIAGIKGAVPIIHGPMSCASGHRIVPLFAGNEPLVPSTSITEIDAVMGTEEKLRKAIYKTYEIYKPTLIVIILTCGTSLVGELYESLLDALQRELNSPIIMVDGNGIDGDEIFGFRDFHNKFMKFLHTKESVVNTKKLDLIGVSPADYGHELNFGILKNLIEDEMDIDINNILFSNIELKNGKWTLGLPVPCGRFWLTQNFSCPAPFGAAGTYRWLKFLADLTKTNLNPTSKQNFLDSKKQIDVFRSKYKTEKLKIAIEAESWWAIGLGKFFAEELDCSVMLSSDIDSITYQDVYGHFANSLVDTGNFELKMEFEEFEPDFVFVSSYANNSKWNWIPFWQPIFHVVKPYKPLMGWSGIPILLSILTEKLES